MYVYITESDVDIILS